MKNTEALANLLKEHGRQEHYPGLWQDNPWKDLFYGYYNQVWNALDRADKQGIDKLANIGYGSSEALKRH